MNDIKDFHNKLLQLLKKMDAICSLQNINYSLFAGTLIGAIRHKGFIPWDDDADVIFERNEYEKFIKVLPAEFTVKTNGWVSRFAYKRNPKIFIDIFVFDSTSKFEIFRKLQVLSLKIVQGTLKNRFTKNKGVIGNILSNILHVIGLPFSKKIKLKTYHKLATMYKDSKSSYMFSSLDQFKYIGKFLPKSILKSYSKVNFEDAELMIIDNYDPYLKKFYGDYMKLPSIENQKPAHGDFRKKFL